MRHIPGGTQSAPHTIPICMHNNETMLSRAPIENATTTGEVELCWVLPRYKLINTFRETIYDAKRIPTVPGTLFVDEG